MSTRPDTLRITAGPFTFAARFESAAAPETCAKFRALLPYRQRLIHVRWSGESCWIPLGDFKLGVDFENHTSHPSRGDILFYPGGFSETEILFPYGSACFSSLSNSAVAWGNCEVFIRDSAHA